MLKKGKLLSHFRLGFAKTDWLSGIRIPRQNSSDELSYAAQSIEGLRPLFPLMGGTLLIIAGVLLWQNLPWPSVPGVIWLVTATGLSAFLLMPSNWVMDRLCAESQVCAARTICLLAAIVGALLGSALGAFPYAAGVPLTLGSLFVALLIFLSFPIAEMVLMTSFALMVLLVGRTIFPVEVVLLCLIAGIVSICTTSRLRFSRARMRMELKKERIAQISNQRGSFVWQTDRDGVLLQASRDLFRVLGRSSKDILNQPLWNLAGDRVQGSHELRREVAFSTNVLKLYHRMQAPFGDLVVCARSQDAIHRLALSGQPRYDASGRFVGFLGVGLDLTDYSNLQERLLVAAERDALTRLMNRACFNRHLEEQLQEHRATALLLIDLDKFKQANDTLGHQVGDQLLRQVAERLQMFINSRGFVGRLGGDEFAVVLHEITDRSRINQLAEELVRFLSSPYEVSGVKVSIGAAVGIAIGPENGETVDALVRNADLALYSVKARGGCHHRFFEATLLEHALQRRQLERDLGRAIENGELKVLYQPIVDTQSEMLCGFEALAFWQHEKRGEVSPDEFIPVAEAAGMIGRLGEWVLNEACNEAAKWPAHLTLAVNLSPTQFTNPALASVVVRSLARARLAPDRLELEITENVFMEETETTHSILRQLHELGVRWTLDDFGTGYSSLKYLLKAPFSKIKIDKEFVNGVSVAESQKRPIVGTVVALAQNLGMQTTAEGVETCNDLKVIRDLGCDQVQGFVYGPKMTAMEARGLTKSNAPIFAEGFKASRREPRMAVLRSADIVYQGRVLPGTVRNVSSGGAMLESEWKASVGKRIQLHMDHDRPRSGIVRWVDGFRFGVQFDEVAVLPESMPGRLIRKAKTPRVVNG